jgi:hypothetical protein
MDLANKAGAPLRITSVVDQSLVILKELAGEKGAGRVPHDYGERV